MEENCAQPDASKGLLGTRFHNLISHPGGVIYYRTLRIFIELQKS